jgi:hypothetical protein
MISLRTDCFALLEKYAAAGQLTLDQAMRFQQLLMVACFSGVMPVLR